MPETPNRPGYEPLFDGLKRAPGLTEAQSNAVADLPCFCVPRWLTCSPRQADFERRRIRSDGVTMSVSRMPNLSFTTTTSPWAIR